MTLSLLSNGTLQDTIVYPLLFLAGVGTKIVHSLMQKKQAKSDVLDTMTADYRALRELYTSKCMEAKQKDEQLKQQAREILELRGRLRSYENFLQTRAPEMDILIKAIAEKIGVEDTGSLQGHPAAHSQAKMEGQS